VSEHAFPHELARAGFGCSVRISAMPALAHEAQAVNEIKRKQRFTVLIRESAIRGHSSNIGEWISSC